MKQQNFKPKTFICDNCQEVTPIEDHVPVYKSDENYCSSCANYLEAKAEDQAEAYYNEALENQATEV